MLWHLYGKYIGYGTCVCMLWHVYRVTYAMACGGGHICYGTCVKGRGQLMGVGYSPYIMWVPGLKRRW